MPTCLRCGAKVGPGAARCGDCGFTSFLPDSPGCAPEPKAGRRRPAPPPLSTATAVRVRRLAFVGLAVAAVPWICLLATGVLNVLIPADGRGGLVLFLASVNLLLAVIGQYGQVMFLIAGLSLALWAGRLVLEARRDQAPSEHKTDDSERLTA